jgi:predicted GNAT family N-acyltransferase
MNICKDISKSIQEDAKYIREKVFIEEQDFQNEFDELDEKSFHLVIYLDGQAAATGRLIPNEESKVYSIGRVAVLQEYRNYKLGNKVLEYLEEKAKEEGAVKLELSAQYAVMKFYQKNGYYEKGVIYYDEHCPHILMEKNLLS